LEKPQGEIKNEKPQGEIKNGQSRKTVNIGYTLSYYLFYLLALTTMTVSGQQILLFFLCVQLLQVETFFYIINSFYLLSLYKP